MKIKSTVKDIHDLRKNFRDLITYVLLQSKSSHKNEQKKVFMNAYMNYLIQRKKRVLEQYSISITQHFNIDLD